MDVIITRSQAEDFSDSSSDDDDDDDTDYLKDIYGYGASLIPSAAAPASAISSAIYEQSGKSVGNPDEKIMIINHANEFERRAREITLASTKTTSSPSSSSSSSNNNSSKITNTATATNNNNNNNNNNSHNTKSSSNEKKEVADIFPLNNGAIMDYAWDDDNDDSKKTVSIYITLPGLDNVNNDDLSISLINENRGIYFTVKNIIATVSSSSGSSTGSNNNTTTTTTTTRFLKIDKLYSKVKNVKLIREIGQNKVIIKLTKDTTTTTTTTPSPISTTTKWYTLQESGSHTINGHDWHDSDDDWTPQEDEAAVNDFLG